MHIKIMAATHKFYDFPSTDLYLPIHVGKALTNEEIGMQGDDTGDHISDKNGSYCELTALYWAWKNNLFKAYDYCGLVHYRRYFKGTLRFGKYEILSDQDIEKILTHYDIIVPKKRNYYIETVQKHYENAHYKKDLIIARNVLERLNIEYLDTYDRFMSQSTLHLYNMFVMPTSQFNDYCNWLFPLLAAIEDELNIETYSPYQKRIFGFLAERLFNVWVLHQNLRICEVKTINTEGENIVLKAIGLLKRKWSDRYKK